MMDTWKRMFLNRQADMRTSLYPEPKLDGQSYTVTHFLCFLFFLHFLFVFFKNKWACWTNKWTPFISDKQKDMGLKYKAQLASHLT